MRKPAGIVLMLLVTGALALSCLTGTAHAFTLSWSPVTTWDDGTSIDTTAVNGIFYNVMFDGVQVATKTSALSWELPIVPKKSAHTATVQTELGTGEKSVWAPTYNWTAPPGNPSAPGQLKIQ